MVLALAAPTIDLSNHLDVALTVFPLAGYAIGQRRWRLLQAPPTAPLPATPNSETARPVSMDLVRRDLVPTWPRTFRVWWALTWRGVVTMFASMVAGGALGGMAGLGVVALGLSPESVGGIASAIGGFLGVAMSVIPVRLVLGMDFGEFRLVLLAPHQRALDAEPLPIAAPEAPNVDGLEPANLS